ncbi:hypothetical protein SSP531S_24610 [Streptomyces spongiicola]|uniref:Uncharacterized protein n=1 Tax=Streptomyces spongiicola TaxID=1690221 RepID=A0A388SYV6_9ACTN|nr:hypothetical protein [Streptomyces spongiicola]GBQ01031.1 hypothetical protein SSP531S_24610 [Streptomyces spongiicola]
MHMTVNSVTTLIPAEPGWTVRIPRKAPNGRETYPVIGWAVVVQGNSNPRTTGTTTAIEPAFYLHQREGIVTPSQMLRDYGLPVTLHPPSDRAEGAVVDQSSPCAREGRSNPGEEPAPWPHP